MEEEKPKPGKQPSAKKAAHADRQKARGEKIEEQILAAEKRRQERQFLEELAKRVSIAREGRAHIERRNYAAAMTAYRRFLVITAKALDIEINQLSPEKFDDKNRVAEALIISSIFFDLLKILDKIDTPSAREERMLYHRLFIRFSKGMPFQHFAAENIRRHLVYSNSLKNKAEFWATYRAIHGRSFCIVATWAFDSSEAPEVLRLRAFRDQVLLRSGLGRGFVKAYYAHGHRLASAMARIPGARQTARALIKTLVARLP